MHVILQLRCVFSGNAKTLNCLAESVETQVVGSPLTLPFHFDSLTMLLYLQII